MKSRGTTAVLVLAALLAPATLLARQSLLKNGSLEYGTGSDGTDPFIPADWSEFGPTGERSLQVNHTSGGVAAYKAYSSDPQVGCYQDVPVTVGQNVRISAWLYTILADRLTGDAKAWINLEFYDPNDQSTGFQALTVLNASSPADTWIQGTLGPFAAPANTSYARMTCVWTHAGHATGSAFWDDCEMTINGSPNVLINGDFETAGQGTSGNPFGIDNWQGWGDQNKSTDVAWDGISSDVMGMGAQGYSGLYQDMGQLSAGDHIYQQAYIRHPAGDPLLNSSLAGIKLEFLSPPLPPAYEYTPFDATADPNTWTLVEIDTTVPDDITAVRATCVLVGDAQTTGEVHFDAVWLERQAFPGANLLENAGFEDGAGGSQGLDGWQEFPGTGGSDICQKSCLELPSYVEGICSARATGTTVIGVYQRRSGAGVQPFEVTPGESVHLHAYLYTPGANKLGGTGKAGIKLEWMYGGIPPQVDIGGATNTITSSTPQDVWTKVYIDYTMGPNTAATGRFTNIIGEYGEATGTAYFDACEAVVLNRFNGSDIDADNDEDLIDFIWFQNRFTGAGAGALPWNGIVFDHDDDLDIDLVDYLWFEPRMLGPLP